MPAVSMPPISARGKARDGSMVSSATLAAFSKPVMAKNASDTPASTAMTGDPSALNSSSTPGSLTPSTSAMTPMATTMIRPLTSMNVMTTLATTDSVIPIRLMTVMMATKASAMTAAIQMESSDRPISPPK